MIVKWNSWESFEERRFAALVVDNITSNTRDLAIALELSYLNVSKAGCEIESNATLPVLHQENTNSLTALIWSY